MRRLNFPAAELIDKLLCLPDVCILDSGGAAHGSRFLIAGFDPVETIVFAGKDAQTTLDDFQTRAVNRNLFAFFTISYEFGMRLQTIVPRPKEVATFDEPDIFAALFRAVVIHDYSTNLTCFAGSEADFDRMERELTAEIPTENSDSKAAALFSTNFSRKEYTGSIERVREYIRCGDTYQVNLTRQIRARLPAQLTPAQIFRRLRRENPASHAAFLRRGSDVVISASPERFFSLQNLAGGRSSITASPIKGTRPRGTSPGADEQLRSDLELSAKDRAENVMIVDLLRNDLGRICRFGTVRVEELCRLVEYPTLFHLVSTIRGELRKDSTLVDIIRALFPCGSITGAPKLRTMQIIDEIETAPRGLSMGAIGYTIPASYASVEDYRVSPFARLKTELNVAIRTMVVRDGEAIFNVGGGITIESDPADEFRETSVKAAALLRAVGAEKGCDV
jgi:para-aminobenzoate synthetase component I